jgi:proteasome lid subunit RPN8/RPN11
MLERLLMHQAHWERMRAHVESCAPMEACGLLAGIGVTVRRVFVVANQERSQSRFRMEAAEQLRAFHAMEESGLELLGIFHSHPAEAPAGSTPGHGPSVTDIEEAAYPAVNVIWSRHEGSWHARGFWIEGGRISDVPLHVIAGQ